MQSLNEQTTAIAVLIRRYIADHPKAADTIEGIHRWWISRSLSTVTPDQVQSAVADLVSKGDLYCTVLPDGIALYHATNRERPGND
jgi:hypothetical protein